MGLTVIVRIFDVDDQAIMGCTITCKEDNVQVLGITRHRIGNVFTASSADVAFTKKWTIEVKHRDYFTETTEIARQNADWGNIRAEWTNHTCFVTVRQEGNDNTYVEVQFVLSRIQFAKLVSLEGDKLPDGVLLRPGTKSTEYKYDRLENLGRTNFRLFGHTILNDMTQNRITFTDVTPNPSAAAKGDFRWLETGPTGKKYAIAIWVPKNYFSGASAITRRKLDFIVIYSPTTKGKIESYTLKDGHTYPYGLNDGKKTPGAPHQPFIATLGQPYLFQRLHFAIQLVAASKKAIVVMPINHYGDWGPFANKPGLHRLLLEVAHCVHKNLLHDAEAHGEARLIPTIRKIILAGYSSGAEPMLGFFQPAPELHPLASVRSTEPKFDDMWKEIWDLDIDLKFQKKDPRSPTWVKRFLGFLAGGTDRRVRMYHGDHIAGRHDEPNPWRPSKDPDLAELIPKEDDDRKKLGRTITDATGRILAEEYYLKEQGRFSVVYLSTPFIESNHNPDKTIPPFPQLPQGTATKIMDARDLALHDYVANFALGHAAIRSGLSKLP